MCIDLIYTKINLEVQTKMFKAWNYLTVNEDKESKNIVEKVNEIYGQSIEMHWVFESSCRWD